MIFSLFFIYFFSVSGSLWYNKVSFLAHCKHFVSYRIVFRLLRLLHFTFRSRSICRLDNAVSTH